MDINESSCKILLKYIQSNTKEIKIKQLQDPIRF